MNLETIETIEDLLTPLKRASKRFKVNIDTPIKDIEKTLNSLKKNKSNIHELEIEKDYILGKNIEKARKSLRMSQLTLSEKLKCSQSEVSKIEAGDRPLSEEKIKEIAKILSKPYGYFFQD